MTVNWGLLFQSLFVYLNGLILTLHSETVFSNSWLWTVSFDQIPGHLVLSVGKALCWVRGTLGQGQSLCPILGTSAQMSFHWASRSRHPPGVAVAVEGKTPEVPQLACKWREGGIPKQVAERCGWWSPTLPCGCTKRTRTALGFSDDCFKNSITHFNTFFTNLNIFLREMAVPGLKQERDKTAW